MAGADRRHGVLLALGLAGVLAAVGMAAAALPGSPGAPPSPLVWRVVRQDFARTVEATGQVRAAAMTQVASPLSNRAVVWLASEGSRVRTGDTIARLDTEDLEDQLLAAEGDMANARADLASAQASLSRTKDELQANLLDLEAKLRVAEAKAALEESKPLPEDRKAAEADAAEADAEAAFAAFWWDSTRRLFEEGAVSGQDVAAARRDDAAARLKREHAHQVLDELLKGAERTALETARAEREQARLSLEDARNSRDKKIAQAQAQVATAENAIKDLERAKVLLAKDVESATVRAPHGGVVFQPSGRRLEAGDTVGRGQALTDLADTSSLYFAARLREPDSPQVQQGQRVTVTLLSAPRPRLEGTVSKMDKALTEDEQSPGVRYLEVQVKLDAPPAGLRPGLTGRAAIQVKSVPGALTVPLSAIRDGAVTVLGPAGPARRPVAVAADDGTMAVVASGLADGDVISLQEE